MRYYEAIKAALAPLGIPYFHNEAHKQATRYIVWSETQASGLSADDSTVNESMMLAVDFFTKDEYDDYGRIREALEKAGFAVNDVVIDYEEKTKFQHFAFTAEWG